jgi:hypothetical protein
MHSMRQEGERLDYPLGSSRVVVFTQDWLDVACLQLHTYIYFSQARLLGFSSEFINIFSCRFTNMALRGREEKKLK